MPRFIDHHSSNPNLPPELAAQIKERLTTGQVDEFGEKGLNVFIGQQVTYCYTEAPSADEVRRSHAALGINVSPADIVEVQVLP